MITVRLLHNVFGEEPAETIRVPFRGDTPAAIARTHRLPGWTKNDRIAVTVEGRRLQGPELEVPLPDDREIVLCPDPGETFKTIFKAYFVPFYAYRWLVGLLVSQPNIGPLNRGDEKSATYAWDQIQTEYRGGFPIPLAYGEHDVGGQAIYVKVSAGGPTFEYLDIILALSAGQCHSIGGVEGTNGEFNWAGRGNPEDPPLPSNLRVNGNSIDPEALPLATFAFGRLGRKGQSPMGGGVLFPGIAITQLVNTQLAEENSQSIATISETKRIETVQVVLWFPAGLYEVASGSGEPIETFVALVFYWRKPGGTWIPAQLGPGPGVMGAVLVVSNATLSQFAHYVPPFPVGSQGTTGPIEVRVVRSTPASTQRQNVVVVRQLVYTLQTGQRFSYPGLSLLGLRIPSTEQTSGGRPLFLMRGKWRMVRVYDETIGSVRPSESRFWEVPDGLYAGIWSYPAGQNPAWVFADFATSVDGLGHYFADSDIDWDTIRDWADFCDQDADVGGELEAFLQFDGVFDQPLRAWDQLQRICRSGRAMPMIVANKLTVKYAYSDAHGRGTNSVAAKAVTQLVSTTNTRNFSVQYLNTRTRPAVFEMQYLNREKNYAQDLEPVADPNGGFNDPTNMNPLGFTKEAVQVFGMVRRSQVIREGLLMHAVNGAVRSEVSFEIGPEGLASQIGDVLAVQHDNFRPYDTEAFAYRIRTDSTAAMSVKLDRPITLEPAKTYQFIIRESDGTVTVATITHAPGTYAPGTAISIDTAVTVKRGGVVTFGEQNKVVKEYEIVEISLEEDLSRKVRALDWVAANYAVPTLASLAQTADYHESSDYQLASDTASQVQNIALVSSPAQGKHRLTWEQPAPHIKALTRVFVRESADAPWRGVAEVVGTEVDLEYLAPGTPYTIAVSIQGHDGAFQSPEIAGQATVTADEFPPFRPARIRRGEVDARDDALLLTWSRTEQTRFDYYEVRRGTEGWLGAQVIAKTKEPQLCIPFPPVDASDQAGTFMVAARARHGLYSDRLLLVSTEQPYSNSALVLDQDPDPSATGTHSNTEWDTDHVKLTDGETSGSWTSAEIVLDADMRLGIAVGVDSWGLDPITVGEATFLVGSGEAHWRTVNGREASVGQPGINPDETVGEMTMTIGDLDDARLVAVYAGEPGVNHQVAVEFRTALLAESISSKDWDPYKIGLVRTVGRIQMRVKLVRSALDLGVFCKAITVRGVAS